MLGCTDKPYEVDFDQPELTMSGVLIAGESPRLFVGRTWSPTGKIPEIPFVEDAEVELFKDNLSVGKFDYVANGMYLLANYKIESGGTYVVKTKGLNSEAQSEPVKVPQPFPLQNLFFDKNAQVTSLNPWAKPRLVNISIQDYPELGNYYGLTVTPYVQGFRLSGNVINVEISNSSLDHRDDDCFQKAPFWTGLYRAPGVPALESNMIIYNDVCFASPAKDFGVVVEMYGTADAPKLFNADADELRIQMAVLSAEYFEFAKTSAKIEGIENAFVEAKRSYSNIKGGHGVIAAMNLTTINVPVKL